MRETSRSTIAKRYEAANRGIGIIIKGDCNEKSSKPKEEMRRG